MAFPFIVQSLHNSRTHATKDVECNCCATIAQPLSGCPGAHLQAQASITGAMQIAFPLAKLGERFH